MHALNVIYGVYSRLIQIIILIFFIVINLKNVSKTLANLAITSLSYELIN